MFDNLLLLDLNISQYIVLLRNDFLDHFFFFITYFGSWPVIVILCFVTAGFFYKYKKTQQIFPLFLTVAGSGIMTLIIKLLVNRSRPGPSLALYTEQLPSFPSAHAALSLALFGFIIYCLIQFDLKVSTKLLASTFFILLVCLIGFSRLYLGVHFLSDVIAGYLAGLLWVLISMYISRHSFK